MLGRGCVRVSRAPAPRSPANPALLARPRAFLGPFRAGPPPSRSQYSAAGLSHLPSLSTSSTPRGVAPPQLRARPRNRPSVCTPFPSLSCYLAGLGVGLFTAVWVSTASLGRLCALSPCGRRGPHPQLAASDLDSGSRALTPPPLPQRTRALPARPLPRAGRGELGHLPLLLCSLRAPRTLSLSRSPRRARSRPARSGLRLLPAPVSAVTALGNMATEGMILTNHDHQIRVGVLTGNRGRRSGTAAAAVAD